MLVAYTRYIYVYYSKYPRVPSACLEYKPLGPADIFTKIIETWLNPTAIPAAHLQLPDQSPPFHGLP